MKTDFNTLYCYYENYDEDSCENWTMENLCEIACNILNHNRLLNEDNEFLIHFFVDLNSAHANNDCAWKFKIDGVLFTKQGIINYCSKKILNWISNIV